MKGKITQVYAGLFALLIFIFLGGKYNYLGTLPLWAVCLEILLMAGVCLQCLCCRLTFSISQQAVMCLMCF